MNTTFTLNIQAPELAHAIETLAIAIGCTVDKIGVGEPIMEAVAQTHVANSANQEMNQQPVQQVVQPMQQIPIQQIPVQNIQTVPIQQQSPIQQQASVQQPVQQTVPTQTQSYTMNQLAIAATQLMDAGKRNELITLLSQFGVQALTALPKEQYGPFATALRGMGARI